MWFPLNSGRSSVIYHWQHIQVPRTLGRTSPTFSAPVPRATQSTQKALSHLGSISQSSILANTVDLMKAIQLLRSLEAPALPEDKLVLGNPEALPVYRTPEYQKQHLNPNTQTTLPYQNSSGDILMDLRTSQSTEPWATKARRPERKQNPRRKYKHTYNSDQLKMSEYKPIIIANQAA